jgi:hypothetical protein
LVINDNFLVNFENYLNQIINFYIHEKLVELVKHYQKILDDYRNKKFYIINSFNIIYDEKGFILFINNYGCIYGFNIIRDQWDKIICCNSSKFYLPQEPHEGKDYYYYYRRNHHDYILNKYILNNYTFNYEYKLSPNKIKLISKLPFSENDSKQINVLFSYLNFIYTNG